MEMTSIRKQIEEINQLSNKIDAVYHEMAQRHGVSDSVFWILYILNSSSECVSQAELCSQWYFSKQTVNSATSSIIKKGWARLETAEGSAKRKNIILTDTGRRISGPMTAEVDKMEETAFSRLDENARTELIAQYADLTAYLREAFDDLEKNNGGETE